MVLKGADLYRAPGDSFNHPRVFLRPDSNDVTYLKRAISVKRDSREEVTERVLQRKTNDDAEDRGSCEERAKINFLVNLVEDQKEKDRKDYKREDVANQSGSFITTSKAKYEVEEQRVEDADAGVHKQ